MWEEGQGLSKATFGSSWGSWKKSCCQSNSWEFLPNSVSCTSFLATAAHQGLDVFGTTRSAKVELHMTFGSCIGPVYILINHKHINTGKRFKFYIMALKTVLLPLFLSPIMEALFKIWPFDHFKPHEMPCRYLILSQSAVLLMNSNW